EWSLRESMSKEHVLPASCVLDGKLYVIGGCYHQSVWNDGEYYDTQKDEWATIASMKKGREGGTAAALNGMIYLVGGYETTRNPFARHSLADVERYDPSTNSWTTMSNMNNRRSSCILAVSCGKLIV
ncbi:hypothetical protein PENTCL1PPCAC_22056, partial [Pristionchus entomophagus]